MTSEVAIMNRKAGLLPSKSPTSVHNPFAESSTIEHDKFVEECHQQPYLMKQKHAEGK
jgi:hypothetical protein